MAIIEKLRSLFGRQTVYNFEFTPEQAPIVEGMSARWLYATQANLHSVVSYLADSIAQLPLKVYTRNSDTDRMRDRESVAAKLLWRPNADQTCYEFINALCVEYLLMGSAVVWVLPDADSESGYQLRIVPREWIKETHRETNYAASSYIVQAGTGGDFVEIPAKDFVEFRMYSPGSPGGFQSPIASLRSTLTEQVNADKFRTEVWSSSGRFNAYITRPANVQPWDDETRQKFVSAFREAWGRGGANAGKMPLLEDGMEIKPYQFNAKEAQFAETKQLSREDVAAAYHVNPSLIWHTSTQTYASAKDNARALYADCLGPVLQMLQQRINSFLLPMIGADPDLYVEFDLTEKLKGSFEERASIIQASVGGPWLTRNEARADNNLPPIEGGNELIVPLNVLAGGQASPQDTHMDPGYDGIDNNAKSCDCPTCAAKKIEYQIKGRSEKEEDEKMSEVLQKFFKRQSKSVLPKLGAKAASWWDEDRWNKELAEDIEPYMGDICEKHGTTAAQRLGVTFGVALTTNYLKAMADGRARAINSATRKKLEKAKAEYDPEDEDSLSPAKVFEKRANVDANTLGKSLATAVASWAVLESVRQAKEKPTFHKRVEKEWITGANARPSHEAMNGERVPVDEEFSNGMFWPGDDNAPAEETCGCNCSTTVIVTEE